MKDTLQLRYGESGSYTVSADGGRTGVTLFEATMTDSIEEVLSDDEIRDAYHMHLDVPRKHPAYGRLIEACMSVRFEFICRAKGFCAVQEEYI